MKTFNISFGGSVFEFVCDFSKTRNGFAHVVNIIKNGCDLGRVKVNYLNRTWESWNFQTACLRAVDKYLRGDEKVFVFDELSNKYF